MLPSKMAERQDMLASSVPDLLLCLQCWLQRPFSFLISLAIVLLRRLCTADIAHFLVFWLQINATSTDDGLNLYDSGHRFEHLQLLLVLLRSLPYASTALQSRVLQVLIICTYCKPLAPPLPRGEKVYPVVYTILGYLIMYDNPIVSEESWRKKRIEKDGSNHQTYLLVQRQGDEGSRN